jgi:hypothetical protein
MQSTFLERRDGFYAAINNNNLQGLKEYTYLHVNTKNDEEEKKSERIPKQELDKLLENIGKKYSKMKSLGLK